MSKLTHRIEKKAVEILVDRIMAERNPADRQKTLKSFARNNFLNYFYEKRLILQKKLISSTIRTHCIEKRPISIDNITHQPDTKSCDNTTISRTI